MALPGGHPLELHQSAFRFFYHVETSRPPLPLLLPRQGNLPVGQGTHTVVPPCGRSLGTAPKRLFFFFESPDLHTSSPTAAIWMGTPQLLSGWALLAAGQGTRSVALPGGHSLFLAITHEPFVLMTCGWCHLTWFKVLDLRWCNFGRPSSDWLKLFLAITHKLFVLMTCGWCHLTWFKVLDLN